MSTATSPAPSATFPSRQHLPPDVEPDKAWKDNLYKSIEETLQSMVDDAKRDYEQRLAAASTEDARGLAEEEYHKGMNNIRNLAKESFQAELNRERQQRMWANGQSMSPQWDRAIKSEQQEILTRIKKTSLGTTTTTNRSSVQPTASASVPTRVEHPTSSSFPPRNGPTAIPAAPTRVNGDHADGHSPRAPEIRNFDHPRVEPRRPQPDPSPPKRRSTSSEVHTMAATPSSVTKSPMPASSPFTSGAPFRPQDPSPTLGIAPINVVARDLPPELAARREQYNSLSRRGSNAASQAREGYPRPAIPSFQSPKVEKPSQPPPASGDDDITTDPEEESAPSPAMGRWNTRRTSSSQDRGVDVPPSRSAERPVAYSPSDRLPARSPSNPQMWKAPMTPDEETAPSRTGTGLARRGSTASIRSTGSGSIRPNIAEPIPEHESESFEREPEREPRRKRDSEKSRPKDLPLDNWAPSEPTAIFDEPDSFSPPKPRSQDIMGPPINPPARPPSTRKPSFQAPTEDRDHYTSQRLRTQASFDDRPFPSPYTPAPPASRPSPRPGTDFYENSRPRDYYPYSAPVLPEGPYGAEQRSNTWRRATQAESPPMRRPSEGPRPGLNREPSYGSKYPRSPDDDPYSYEDRYPEFPSSKYDKFEHHPSPAIPIRQRPPSHGEDTGWKNWSAEPPIRPRTTRPRDFDDYPSRGYDLYDREREYRPRDDHWSREERDFDDHRNYERPYHGPVRYSSEMVHSNSRDSYGLAKSSPSSYRNEHHHRFGGREYRPQYGDDDEDDYLDNPYTRDYPDSTRYTRDYHRVRRSNFEREAAEVRTELFKDIRHQHGRPRYLDPPSSEDSQLSISDEEEEDDADDELSRPAFIRQKPSSRMKPERKMKEDPALKEEDERKRREEEARRQEEEEKRRLEEEARRQEEIERKARELVEEMRKKEEEQKRLEEEARQREEAERKQIEEEARQREEEEAKRIADEQRKKQEQENKKKEREARKREHHEAQLRKKEEERQRREEDERKRREEDERQRKEEEAQRKEEEAQRKEEELRRKEEIIRRKEEEWRRKEQEAKKKEEETRRKEEEFKRKEHEARKKEEETRRKEEEFRRKEQEAKRKEQEAKKKERELKRKEEEARKKEEEARRREEELQTERRRVEEEARRREEELEAERKRVEEEAKKREEEAQKREEDLRRREEEFQRLQSDLAKSRNLQQEEFRKREEEIRRRKGDAFDPETGWAPSSYGSASSFGGRSFRKEDESRLAEGARRKEEEARREREKEEEERIRREQQEEDDRKAAEELQEQLLEEAREEERRLRDAQQKETERKKMDEIWRQRQTEQAKRKQQEEYRRQEEQIRQQAEERKRQRSGTQEFANGSSSHYPTSSSPPWSSQTSNAWGSPQPSFNSTSRSSTTSYSPSFEPFSQRDDGMTDWQRRQEEMAQKQQEQFRKEQERLESLRQARDAGRMPSKNDILAIYDSHERLWATMGSKSQLRWRDFPWPMFKAPASPEEITTQTVSAYMQSPHYPETVKIKTYKDRLREHIRRWHPDRFETQTLPRVVEDQKETVREAAGSVVRALNDLNSRANNVNDVFS